jgi:DeoR/GlpR family transcriptional regulator of sugar metabolism
MYRRRTEGRHGSRRILNTTAESNAMSTSSIEVTFEITDEQLRSLLNELATTNLLHGLHRIMVIGDDGDPKDIAPFLPDGYVARAGVIAREGVAEGC